MPCRTARSLPAVVLFLSFASPAPAAEPASPGASPEARKVLDYFSRLPGRYDRRVISGQHLGSEEEPARQYSERVTKLRESSGRWVAMIGADYGCAEDQPLASPRCSLTASNRILADHWKSGGLALVSFYPRNPWTGGGARDTAARSLEEVITPGTAPHAAWMKELDAAAAALAELRDAGVVVLWRPFHGMNGGSFWWGRRDGEPFRKQGFVSLWSHMFDYFARTKKLNNLVWVYSASSAAHRKISATAFFPGSEYCDIVGLECSSSEFVLDGYNDMVQLGKPFGITSFGPSREEPGAVDHAGLIEGIRFWYALSSFFVASGGDSAIAAGRNGAALMTDPWVISREDLGWAVPGFRRWKKAEQLAVKKVEVLTADPECWKRVDIRVDLGATFETPFDPQQIEVDALFRTPSGKSMTVPAFFDQPFERRVWGGGRFSEEVMVEAGPPEWRVRFTPSEPGDHRFTIRARDRSGSVESSPSAFRARASAGSGYIRVSKADRRYFEFDDGTPFFAIGLNIVEHPLSEYYRYLPRLARNGGNSSRLWMGFDYFALEHGPIGEYRLDNAWRLDQVMDLSELHGIYQKLCIDWIRNIPAPGEPGKTFDREDYAYSAVNGGPCSSMKDFFTLPEARRLFRNRLRYIVARWGYSTKVLAWELWNEIDMVERKAAEVTVIVPWNQEMCRYLKSIDPWQHLTTNSLSGRSMGQALWTLEENDFAQRHGYLVPRPQAVLASADMAGSVIQWLDDVARFDKPYLLSEFGLQRDRMDARSICDRDQEGVHMHNGIWASLVHGAAGTAQLWWWGQYVDPKNLWRQFQGVAGFVRGIPWPAAGFVKAEIRAADENLRALGLVGKSLSILWLQNRAHTWWNVVSGNPIPPLQPGEVAIEGFLPGQYRVEYWNTYEGRIDGTALVTAAGGSLRLKTPGIETDIAVKIFPRARNRGLPRK